MRGIKRGRHKIERAHVEHADNLSLAEQAPVHIGVDLTGAEILPQLLHIPIKYRRIGEAVHFRLLFKKLQIRRLLKKADAQAVEFRKVHIVHRTVLRHAQGHRVHARPNGRKLKLAGALGCPGDPAGKINPALCKVFLQRIQRDGHPFHLPARQLPHALEKRGHIAPQRIVPTMEKAVGFQQADPHRLRLSGQMSGHRREKRQSPRRKHLRSGRLRRHAV